MYIFLILEDADNDMTRAINVRILTIFCACTYNSAYRDASGEGLLAFPVHIFDCVWSEYVRKVIGILVCQSLEDNLLNFLMEIS